MKDKIAEYLVNNHKVKCLFRKVVIDGDSYTLVSFMERVVMEVIANLGLASDFLKNYPNDSSKKDLTNDILEAIKRLQRKDLEAKHSNEEFGESRINVEYIPAVDVETNNTFLIEPNTKKISKLSFDAWVRIMSKDEKALINSQLRFIVFAYDPYNIETLNKVPFEGQELFRVNSYNPPKWRSMGNTKPQMPELINQLLTHLFPSEEAVTYILDWLYFCLMDRNEAYLVLNGAKGVGKGVFCSLITALVGKDNSVEAPVGFLGGQFNSALDQKRFILMDEFKVTPENHAKLKRYINKYQNIEKKGKDADKSVETYNSFVISNNDESDMYLEHDDRRFSVIDMTKIPLLDVIEEEVVQGLVKELDNEESDLIRDFGYYIFNRGAVKYSVFSTFKGEKFHTLVENSLKEWQKFILTELLEGEEELLSISELRTKYSKNDGRKKLPYKIPKIEDFLKNYRYMGDTIIGEMVKEGGEWCIRCAPEFLEIEDEDLL